MPLIFDCFSRNYSWINSLLMVITMSLKKTFNERVLMWLRCSQVCAHTFFPVAWYSNILLNNQMDADKRDGEEKTASSRYNPSQTDWGISFLFPWLPWKHSSEHTIRNGNMVMRTGKPPHRTFRSHCFPRTLQVFLADASLTGQLLLVG